MREDTKKLLEEISTFEAIGDFLFVGGTAIAYHVGHRLSEDLDFGFLGLNLPTIKINKIIVQLQKTHQVTLQTDVTAIEEAFNEGNDLMQHYQDWQVDDVKLTFFSLGNNEIERQTLAGYLTENIGHVKVLSMEGLFVTKCLALANRIKSRDIFDLWWFIEHGGKSIQDVFYTIQMLMPHTTYERVRYKLLDWPIPLTDEGLEPLDLEISIDQVRDQLREKVNALEVEMAGAFKASSMHRP